LEPSTQPTLEPTPEPTLEPSPTPEASQARKVNSMGMGLSAISYYSTENPFIDYMKQAQAWRDRDTEMNDFDLDDQGWVRSLQPGQAAGTVFLSTSNESLMYRKFVVLYDGDGTIEYDWSAAKITAESSPGRDVISTGTGSHLLKITAVNPDNYLRNIRIIPELYLSAYQAGAIFNPDWINLVSPFRAVRFMDWMQTNHSSQSTWQNRPKLADRSWAIKGVPLEAMLALANQINADPWFNIPHLADENYITAFATLIKQQLNTQLYVYVEHSNEVWNRGFEQWQAAENQAQALWGDVDYGYMQWHGMRTAQICDIFKTSVFSGDSNRVKCVLGVQTAWRDTASAALDCPAWVAQDNKPCFQHQFDYIGITSYFDGGLNGPRLETDTAHINIIKSFLSEPDGGLNKAFEQLETGQHIKSISKFSDFNGVANDTRSRLANWLELANERGLAGVVAYEGGQHITSNGLALQNDDATIQFHTGINRDPRIGEVYADLLESWKLGGGLLHMHYTDVASYSKYGSWGALENLNQTDSYKWQVLTDFNLNTPCWWSNCSQ
jgi:hypothetical protein